jgi:hypothetical protein
LNMRPPRYLSVVCPLSALNFAPMGAFSFVVVTR